MKQAHAKIVSPENVAAEFEKIRRQANVDESGASNQSVVRATLANVIFLAGAEDIAPVISQLGKQLPSRFFTVEIDDNIEESVVVSVGAQSLENSSGQYLQSEEIYIQVKANNVDSIPNLLLSNLVPDIDVVIVECDDFSKVHSGSDEIMKVLKEKLLKFADIYVSKDLTPFVGVESLGESDMKRCSFRSWSIPLIAKWCAIISEQFNSDHVLESLKDLKEINIEYTSANQKVFEHGADHNDYLKNVPTDVTSLVSWINNCLRLEINKQDVQKDGKLYVQASPIENTFLTSDVKITLNKIDLNNTANVSHVKSVVFMMGDSNNSFEVACRYLDDSNLVEVSNGGSLHNQTEESCDFYVRRIPAPQIAYTDALLMAIRNQPIDCKI